MTNMSEEDFQGIAEHCYRDGCDNWITGSLDYCSSECEELASSSNSDSENDVPDER